VRVIFLTLSCARVRKRFGQKEKCVPSPFLKEPEQSGMRWVDRDKDTEEAKEEAEDFMAAMRRNLERQAAGR